MDWLLLPGGMKMSGYEVKNVTPKILDCVVGVCPAIYEEILDLTPREFDCAIGLCPAVYSAVRELGTNPNDCVVGACPEIQEKGNVYLIIGKLVDAKVAGLEKKIGEGEVLIEVPRELIDKINR